MANAILPHEVKQRLETIAGRQLSQDGILIVTAQEHRSQERNRATALEKLVALLRKASVRPKRRIATQAHQGFKDTASRFKIKTLHDQKPAAFQAVI